MRHGRAPAPWPARRRAVPDHPGPRQRRTRARDRRRAHGRRWRADRHGPAGDVLRRVRHLRRVLALPGGEGRDALPAAPGVRHHDRARGRRPRGMGGADRDQARRAAAAPARGLERPRVHGRRLRAADRLPRGRARSDSARRHGGRAGQRAGRPQRGDLRAARRGAPRAGDRRAPRAARGGAKARRLRHARHQRGRGSRGTSALGARAHRGPRRGRGDRGLGQPASRGRRPRDGARRRALRRGRPVHRRGRRHAQPPPPRQPQPRDDPRLLGLRVHAPAPRRCR